MKDINTKTVLDEETSQFYYEGLADYTKYRESNVAHYLDELSRPNLLINGDFQVWQRGEEFIISDNSSIYTADRHRLSLSNIGDYNKVTRTQNGFKLETTQVIPGANRYLCYQMEKNDFEKLKGKEVTFSIKVRKLTEASEVNLTVYGNFEAESWKTVSLKNTEFETYTFTYLFKTDILEKSVLYTLDNSSTEIGGGFEVQYIKLELGSFVTPFYPRNYVDELMMCKRYYELVLLMSNKNDLFTKTTNLLGVSTSCHEKRISKPIITSYDSNSHPNKCSRFIAGVSTTPGQPVRITFDNQYGWVEVQSDTGSSANGVLAFLKIDAEIY